MSRALIVAALLLLSHQGYGGLAALSDASRVAVALRLAVLADRSLALKRWCSVHSAGDDHPAPGLDPSPRCAVTLTWLPPSGGGLDPCAGAGTPPGPPTAARHYRIGVECRLWPGAATRPWLELRLFR